MPHWEDFESAGGDSRDNAVLVAVDEKGLKLITGTTTKNDTIESGTKVDRNFGFLVVGA